MWILARVLLCSFLFMTYPLLAKAATCGTFTHIEGDVKFLPEKGETQWEAAVVGRNICPGGSIATASTGRATIKFPGGEELHISPSTRLVVAAMESDAANQKKKALMNLINGKVRANIPPDSYKSSDAQFRIRSETAVAGVRGTQFVMSYSSQTKSSEVVTLRGQVEVGKPVGRGFNFTNPVMVKSGQKTVASLTAPPAPPIDLPADEVKGIDDATASAPAESSGGEGTQVADSAPAENNSSEGQGSNSENAQSPSSSTESREPASVEPPSMVGPGDMGPPPTDTFAGPPDMILNEPVRNNLPPPIVCDFCDDRIADGPARLKIRVIKGQQAP